MIIKEIFSKDQNTIRELTIKKILNKNIYQKLYIRSAFSPVHIIDNNSNLLNLPDHNFLEIYGKAYSNTEGLSINASSYIYKNKLNGDLRFESFALNARRDKNLLDSFYGSLRTLKQVDAKIPNSLLILKPMKGGFLAYSSGVCGFLPRIHGLYFVALTLILASRTNQIVKRILNLASLVCFQNRSKILHLFRLEFVLGKILLYFPIIKQNNFSQIPHGKRKALVNDYNFVFLSQKVQNYRNNLTKPNEKNKKIINK